MTDIDNKEREPLYLAAINCPHEIDHNRIVLHYDDTQPGHNALAQLGDRLAKAAQQAAVPEGFALVPIEPTAENIAAMREFSGKGGYLNFGTANGDSVEAWQKRVYSELYRVAIAAAPTPPPVEYWAVAWANVREDGVIVGLSQHSEDIARWQNPRPLYTAPPAQAGEPKLTDTAWLEHQLRELYRLTANRTCGWMTFVKIGVALLATASKEGRS